MATCFTHPLDLLKVRLQTTTRSGGATPTGDPRLRQVLVQVLRQESPWALFQGLSASLLRQLTYSTVRFALYEQCKLAYLESHPAQPFPLAASLAAGLLAGSVAGVAGNPADVINVRMQNDGKLEWKERRNYRHAVDGLVQVVRQEGTAALFRGLSANVLRGMIMTASQLGSYDQAKSLLLHLQPNYFPSDSVRTHFLASLMAGLVATTASSPMDVVKTRIMSTASSTTTSTSSSTSGVATGKATTSTWKVLVEMVRQEGVPSLFRGWLPAYSRLGPQTILTFVFLEQWKAWWKKLQVASEAHEARKASA